MRSPLVVTPSREAYWLGHRTHHGAWGCALIAAAGLVPGDRLVLRSVLVGLGAGLVAHDWADRSRWLRDLLAHPAVRR